MGYHPELIQSGRWCALFENFTLQRLAAQIRAGLRWTTAPCQWITHFTAGNQHNYGGNIGDAGILIKELPLRAGRDKLRIDNFKWVTVVLCACATRNVHVVIHAPKTKENVLPCFGDRRTSQNPLSDRKGATNSPQRSHTGTSALCCPNFFSPTQQDSTTGLYPGSNASKLHGEEALFSSLSPPPLPPLFVDMTCAAGNLITPVSKGEPG